MTLTDENITELQTLYREKLGKEISREEAYEEGIKLVRLVSIVYQPMTKAEYAMIKKRQEQISLLAKEGELPKKKKQK